MAWQLYQWLWPLFIPCQGHNLTVTVQARRVMNSVDGLIPVMTKQTIALCPTPAMQGLLVLALLGLVSGLVLSGYGVYKLDRRLVAEQQVAYHEWIFRQAAGAAPPVFVPGLTAKQAAAPPVSDLSEALAELDRRSKEVLEHLG